ncbi:MAG: AAA family ATPase [Hyphomonadaceae bacterium]|nr:AAA family ATPase [Clostridia bacterium]
MMMKRLCRIRLINWHYFANETINVSGSFLISGENTAGKSTVLDAIQLVLTTNHRKFNTAANEKSSRDLKGYVRCKTGDENNTYVRNGSVITYVALEFYEQKSSKYFTLGVKIDSPDEESKLSTKWFREECRLDDLSFVTGGRPSTTEEFRKNDKKIPLIHQILEAKAHFGRRLGNLEHKFFDMIPKSLAFKPMDNVKDFINKFILSEKAIEVATLRNNIATLKELEDLMNITKAKVEKLEAILMINGEILAKEQEIKTNEVLIKKAELEAKKLEIDRIEKENSQCEYNLRAAQSNEQRIGTNLENKRSRISTLKVAASQNETSQLITEIQHKIEIYEIALNAANAAFEKLKGMQKKVLEALTVLGKNDIFVLSKEDVLNVTVASVSSQEKSEKIFQLKHAFLGLTQTYNHDIFVIANELKLGKEEKINLEREISNLKNKKLTYPENTVKLKHAIEKEFLQLGLHAPVRIFSELLEITDALWQNAVEGYLNSQRFYIIVEPQHYTVALEVYNRIKKEVHTVGLINTSKLDIDAVADTQSLAYVVKSDNRYAKAYAIFLLNKVVRCEDVHHLKLHKVAITTDCMLYQNHAVRKIDERVYSTPYIGASAFEIQLKNKLNALEKLNEGMKIANEKLTLQRHVLEKLSSCNFDVLDENIQSPMQVENIQASIHIELQNLKNAQSDPSYLQLQMEIEDCENSIKSLADAYKAANEKIGSIKNELVANEKNKKDMLQLKDALEHSYNTFCEDNAQVAVLGADKYLEQVKTKSPATIVANFSPRKIAIENEKMRYCTELVKLQTSYCSIYDSDLGWGLEQIKHYINEHHKLTASDMIRFEEDLKRAKENCELEFRESFLARLKENIETAYAEFKNLNAALKNIYYGEDSYKFEITHNKKKESIYRMITSKNNMEGFTLLSQNFDEEYREEMEDLFSKLTAYDDKGEKVLAEYTDYRSYLDYDIIVEKKDGSIQRFSKIYGEKSGGETQTPYYVAIAASFVQLYKSGDTIRIIMLDEAFDKMDDNRINAMMDFLNSQNFQIILATPPSKLEVIGEKVDTILMAMRDGKTSIIEEYDL